MKVNLKSFLLFTSLFLVFLVGCHDPFETDNSPEQANAAYLNMPQDHVIWKSSDSIQDQDWVKFQAINGEIYSLEAKEICTDNCLLDLKVELFSNDGTLDISSQIKDDKWTCSETGIYYLKITNNNVTNKSLPYGIIIKRVTKNEKWLKDTVDLIVKVRDAETGELIPDVIITTNYNDSAITGNHDNTAGEAKLRIKPGTITFTLRSPEYKSVTVEKEIKGFICHTNFTMEPREEIEVAPKIETDTIWKKDKIYFITQDTEILKDVKLTIEPGATIYFKGPKHIWFDVNGSLVAEGKKDEKINITIHPDSLDDGLVRRIRMISEAKDFILKHCKIKGISMRIVPITLDFKKVALIDNCDISESGGYPAIEVITPNAEDSEELFFDFSIINSKIHDNHYTGLGIIGVAKNLKEYLISDCEIYNHPIGKGNGITYDSYDSDSRIRIENSKLHNNDFDIFVDNDADVTLDNLSFGSKNKVLALRDRQNPVIVKNCYKNPDAGGILLVDCAPNFEAPIIGTKVENLDISCSEFNKFDFKFDVPQEVSSEIFDYSFYYSFSGDSDLKWVWSKASYLKKDSPPIVQGKGFGMYIFYDLDPVSEAQFVIDPNSWELIFCFQIIAHRFNLIYVKKDAVVIEE